MDNICVIPEKSKQIILHHCSKVPDLVAIYVFGSLVKGNGDTHSDIDIAFLSHQAVDDVYRWQLAQDIAIDLQLDVDLVDLNNCSEVFAFQIISTGILLHTNDMKRTDIFADKVFWQYMDLQELRKQQIEEIYQKGTVYG